MVKCSYCQQNNSDEAMECRACGAPLSIFLARVDNDYIPIYSAGTPGVYKYYDPNTRRFIDGLPVGLSSATS